MQLKVNAKELLTALQQAKPMKPYRRLPVLSNALLSVADFKASVTTTDLERVTTIDLKCNADQSFTPFTLLLPLKTTEIFLHGANGDVILGKTKEGHTTLTRVGLGTCKITPECKVEDFPLTPKDDELTWATLDAKWFCQMLSIAIPACAIELSRPVLNGIWCKDGSMASADGFRLVAIENDKLSFGLGEKQAIIPLLTGKLICKLFNKVETLEVAFNNSMSGVFFRSGNTSIVSNVIQGNYPKYEELIPQTFNCKVSFSTPLMLQRLGMIDNIYKSITRFEFHKKEREHECLISAGTQDELRYSLTCPIKIDSENDAKIAFDKIYFQDAIKPFSMTTLELSSPSSPGKFTGDIEGLTIVVMPMFVQW